MDVRLIRQYGGRASARRSSLLFESGISRCCTQFFTIACSRIQGFQKLFKQRVELLRILRAQYFLTNFAPVSAINWTHEIKPSTFKSLLEKACGVPKS
jgi:hypothetical protein